MQDNITVYKSPCDMTASARIMELYKLYHFGERSYPRHAPGNTSPVGNVHCLFRMFGLRVSEPVHRASHDLRAYLYRT